MGMFLEESRQAFRPRVLVVLLEPAGPGRGPAIRVQRGLWESTDPELQPIGDLCGSALALCLCLEDVRAGEGGSSLYLAVGSAVRVGLPTAARATVAGLSPLGGGSGEGSYVDGQVGGGFAGRLAQLTDALVLRGSLGPGAGRVLILDRAGQARLEELPELASLDLPARTVRLRALHPDARGLCVGSAGEAGVRFANLATLADPPSFTGRGGLGARLGASGLTALLVEGDEPAEPETMRAWAEALASSPHLRARGAGGTFEQLEAFAARGDVAVEAGASAPFTGRLSQRQSCPGCPTACRHVLKVGGRRVAGRFSATFPLGSALGLSGAAEALGLLEACNAVGVDAAEMGATLAVAQSLQESAKYPGPRLRGDAVALGAAIAEVAGSPLAEGAQRLARTLAGESTVLSARGSSVRRTSDLASLLGQFASARGSDPMRAFPFLAENGGDEERLARLATPLVDMPPETFDPQSPVGKGRLVWWHENLANALDASGFCAFSAAGLVGDGFASLDQLASWLALPGLEPTGEALQAAGASMALLQRELAQRSDGRAEADWPSSVRQLLEARGMWDEYCLVRGLDGTGRIRPEARQRIGSLDLVRWGPAQLAQTRVLRSDPPPPTTRAPGSLELHASGPLAQALGQPFEDGLELPATLGEVLRALVALRPASAPWLGADGDGAVCVYRRRRRMTRSDLVHDGDRLDLVVAISGG